MCKFRLNVSSCLSEQPLPTDQHNKTLLHCFVVKFIDEQGALLTDRIPADKNPDPPLVFNSVFYFCLGLSQYVEIFL